MDYTETARRIEEHIGFLCACLPDRRVGGPGNREATAYFARIAEEAGCSVERLPITHPYWEPVEAAITAGDLTMGLEVGPYAHATDVEAPLVTASTLAELEACSAHGAVLLLHGEIAAHQMTPANYPFYAVPAHTTVLAALAEAAPAVVIAATGHDPEMAGGQTPFPLFDDGDLNFPTTFTTEDVGAALLTHAGQLVHVRIDSSVTPSPAEQLIATLPGTREGLVLVCAHIDAKAGTPGALDNAAGVASLLVLAGLLAGETVSRPTVELVPFNGEDDYAATGELAYLEHAKERLESTKLVVNLDAAGHVGTRVAVSTYNLDATTEAAVRQRIATDPLLAEGPSWIQSDHAIFAMREMPCMALTSDDVKTLLANIAHTPKDTPELVDARAMVAASRFIAGLIAGLA